MNFSVMSRTQASDVFDCVVATVGERDNVVNLRVRKAFHRLEYGMGTVRHLAFM